jgi:hypothetical protein
MPPKLVAAAPTPAAKIVKPAEKPKTPAVKPEAKVAATPAKPAKEEPPATDASGVPTIEGITKNWTEIPKGLFAQRPHILVSKDVELKLGGGAGMTLKSGGIAVALDQNGDTLVIAPTTNLAARGTISLKDTDIKKVISEMYDQWKVAQAELAKSGAGKGPQDDFGKRKLPPTLRNTKPTRNSDGSYPILVESMRLGQVREITPSKIKKWGEAQLEMINGKEYWTVVVNYTTSTMFGDFNVDAQARVYGGKVERWVYMSSEETVP